jgi:YjbE family integral membrane protein
VTLHALYLDTSFWTPLLQMESNSLRHPTFWIAAIRIVVINLLLSGDNALVIAMACRGLPRRQRIWGIAIGAGVAVFLLIVLTAIVTWLIALPFLKMAGGLALFYIAARLLLPEQSNENAVATAADLWRAVWIVVIADLIMSFDNVLAVATAAHGDLALLAVGLIVSIPIIMAGAAVIMALLDRLPSLVWIGAAFLGSVGGEAIATDPVASHYLAGVFGEDAIRQAVWAASAFGAVFAIAVGGAWRRAQLTNPRAPSPRP